MSKEVQLAVKVPQLPSTIEIDPKWTNERDALVAKSAELTSIDGQQELDLAGSILYNITKASAAMETMRKQLAKPFRETDKKIKAIADKAREPLETEKVRLKALMADYAQNELEKVREQQRLVEEARRAEAERQVADAVELGLDPTEIQDVPVYVAPETKPAAASASFSEKITWSIDDEDAVARFLCSPDSKKINEYVRDNKDNLRACITDNNGNLSKFGVNFRIETTVKAR